MAEYVVMHAPTHASQAPVEPPSEQQARAAADLLRLLADPTRLRLLAALVEENRDVTALTELTGVPRPAVSQHLGRLRLAGLVTARPQGRQRIYALRNGHVRRLVTETLAHAEHLLDNLPDHR